jgi:hypothetical protein
VHADLWPALGIFIDLASQWTVADGFRIGLRYEVLPMMFDLHGIPAADRRDALADIRTCEREALRLWSKRG